MAGPGPVTNARIYDSSNEVCVAGDGEAFAQQAGLAPPSTSVGNGIVRDHYPLTWQQIGWGDNPLGGIRRPVAGQIPPGWRLDEGGPETLADGSQVFRPAQIVPDQCPPGFHWVAGQFDQNRIWHDGYMQRDHASNCGNQQPPASNPNAMTTTPLPGGGIDVKYTGANGTAHEIQIARNGDMWIDGVKAMPDGVGLAGGTVSKDGNTITITGKGEQMTVTAGPNGLQTSVIPLPQSAMAAPALSQAQTNSINADLQNAGLQSGSPDIASILKDPSKLNAQDAKKVADILKNYGTDLNKLLNGASGTNGSSTASSSGQGYFDPDTHSWVDTSTPSSNASTASSSGQGYFDPDTHSWVDTSTPSSNASTASSSGQGYFDPDTHSWVDTSTPPSGSSDASSTGQGYFDPDTHSWVDTSTPPSDASPTPVSGDAGNSGFDTDSPDPYGV